MRISFVIPFYNEEANVLPLAREIADVMTGLDHPFSVVLVDDGSTDRTWARIGEAKDECPNVRGLRLLTNQGQSAALLAGLRAARGDILVTLDGDCQNDPRDIPKLLSALKGVDCVCGRRAQRRDSWSRRAASRLANRVRNLVTGDGVRDTGCGLKAFRRPCLDALPPLRGMHRFMPAYFRLHGYVLTEVPVRHRPRLRGHSKYGNLQRLPRALLDLAGFWWYRRRLLRVSPVEETPNGPAPPQERVNGGE
jgi:dolichol-phosphate mannosyltransferase